MFDTMFENNRSFGRLLFGQHYQERKIEKGPTTEHLGEVLFTHQSVEFFCEEGSCGPIYHSIWVQPERVWLVSDGVFFIEGRWGYPGQCQTNYCICYFDAGTSAGWMRN
ncbi:hypothetical protein HGB13_01695 [bacterium]|nr:hypothetical protein [bacterium]